MLYFYDIIPNVYRCGLTEEMSVYESVAIKMPEGSENLIPEWLSSEEYFVDIDELCAELSKSANSSENESQTADAFKRALYFLIRSKTGINVDFSSEQKMGSVIHKFDTPLSRSLGKERSERIVNSLVIEYKHHSKLDTAEQYKAAVSRIEDYLEALYKNEEIRYSAILTDGIRISYFTYTQNGINHSSLAPISAKDIDTVIRAILLREKKKFVPSNILKDFNISLTAPSLSKSVASMLYDSLKNNATGKTEMLYTEWKNLMHLSLDDNGKNNDIEKRRKDLSLIFSDSVDSPESEYKALYSLQTTYAVIVKLIACKVIDGLEYNDSAKNYYDLTNITSSEMQLFFEKMEDGYSYKSSNINNFLEGDFFSWYADKEQWSADFQNLIKEVVKLIDQYSAFSFNVSYNPIDIFKDLYMSIIPKSIRHSMGEYFTPEWLADYVVTESIKQIDNKASWRAIDPCCGSGIFIISLIKHIVGDIDIQSLTEEQKTEIRNDILSRVYGVDINPLSVLSARVGYYLALQPFGNLRNIEIPVYLGDSAIIPAKEKVDGIDCYRYSVHNMKLPFEILLPERFVKSKDFGTVMSRLQAAVKTGDSKILFAVLEDKLSKEEKESETLTESITKLSEALAYLHKNNWDGIWIRILTNYMSIAGLTDFDMIVGNPPWVKWEHLPALYAGRIKKLCDIRHIFANDMGQFGGTQLNICALISNVTATNWLSLRGVLAFLMPDSIMSQNSYEEFRNFYINYETKERLYLQKVDKWEAPLRPFRCDDKPVTQDFNTYYFSSRTADYKGGIPVSVISRKKEITDEELNTYTSYEKARPYLTTKSGRAVRLSARSTAFSYVSGKYGFSRIIGDTGYCYRTGVEFTPQELYMLTGMGKAERANHYRFAGKKFKLSKYSVDDMPKDGWVLPTKYIYPIATGPDITPFCFDYKNEFCILPYDKENTKKPIQASDMIAYNGELFSYLASHKELIDKQSEKSKQMHRGDEFYALSKIGPYTFAESIVAARDNSKFCASVITPRMTPWGEFKQTICVKHTIIISRDKNGRNISADEANYICGILNSDIVTDYIKSSFKSNGYSLNKSNLYIPLYDEGNGLHKKISSLAEKAKTADTNERALIASEITGVYLAICDDRK